MDIILKNDALTVGIRTRGAEIFEISGTTGGGEYFCPTETTGVPTILFPNLTAIKDGYILVNGASYPLPHGGFAKSEEFAVVSRTEVSVKLRLIENAATLALFPFPFQLDAEYILAGRTLTVKTEVRNTGGSDLRYALGYHPAYLCRTEEEPYTLYFDEPLTADRFIREQMLFTTAVEEKFFDHLVSLSLSEKLFAAGTIALTALSGRRLRIVGERSGRTVAVNLGDYPNLALWAPADRPLAFVCAECWDGAPDRADTNHVWEEKPDLRRLAPGGSSTRTFSVSFS